MVNDVDSGPPDDSRVPTEERLDPLLAEVQAEDLTVPQAEGEPLLGAFLEATDELGEAGDEDES